MVERNHLKQGNEVLDNEKLGSNTCISHRDACELSYEPQWPPDTTCTFKTQENQSGTKICHCIMKYDVLIFFTPLPHFSSPPLLTAAVSLSHPSLI